MEDIVKSINELNRKDIWDFLSIVSLFISALFLILTYFLARRINKKIDKPIREKQLNTVYELIEVLQTTIFKFSIIGINCVIKGNPIEIKFFKIKTTKFGKSLLNNEIVINKDDYTKLKFIKYKDNPFLPPKIANLLGKIDFDLIDKKDLKKDDKNYTLIGGSVEILIAHDSGEDIIYKTNSIKTL